MRSSASKLFKIGVLTLGALAASVRAADTVKVGVLHSLSGTMAISETSLRDVLLFTFDEINAKGGVLGKKIEPVVVDGASNWPLFAEKATQPAAAEPVPSAKIAGSTPCTDTPPPRTKTADSGMSIP